MKYVLLTIMHLVSKNAYILLSKKKLKAKHWWHTPLIPEAEASGSM